MVDLSQYDDQLVVLQEQVRLGLVDLAERLEREHGIPDEARLRFELLGVVVAVADIEDGDTARNVVRNDGRPFGTHVAHVGRFSPIYVLSHAIAQATSASLLGTMKKKSTELK